MTSTNLHQRPANLKDTFINCTGRFIVLEDEEGVVAWGGVAFAGGSYEAVMTVEREGYGPSIARAAKSFQSIFNSYSYVIAREGNKLTAPRFLTWLGFVPIDKIENRVFYKWLKKEV